MARTNEKDTRIVRTYASDLAIGDVIVNGGEYVGIVASVPMIDRASGRVTYHMDQADGREPVVVTVSDLKVVRIEIGRRTS